MMDAVANIAWSDRPKTLKDFPDHTQTRLKQLEPQRIISINVGGTLFVRRIGLNKFQCGIAESAMPDFVQLPVAC